MQSSRRLELYRNDIKNHGQQLSVAGDRADLPDGMSKGLRNGLCGGTMYLGLHGFELAASRAYIYPKVTWRSPGSMTGTNRGCARKPMQACVPILPHGGGYLSAAHTDGADCRTSAHRTTRL